MCLQTPCRSQDSPNGELTVEVLKNASKMCKFCFYVKRGSFQNVKEQELQKAVAEHKTVAEKCLGLLFGCCWHLNFLYHMVSHMFTGFWPVEGVAFHVCIQDPVMAPGLTKAC